jgi:hypothetical protein
LPKTRLQGLHGQLLRANDSTRTAKLEVLLPLYLGALPPNNYRNLKVMSRVVDLETKQVLAIDVLSVPVYP